MASLHLVRLMMRPKLANLKLGPEDQMAVQFADGLRVFALQGKLKAVWTHVANEMAGAGKTKDENARKTSIRLAQIRYAIAKALGLISGTSDYLFLWEGGSGALEAKAPGKPQRPEQKDFQKWCEENGVPYRIFHTPKEGYLVLEEWGVLKR